MGEAPFIPHNVKLFAGVELAYYNCEDGNTYKFGHVENGVAHFFVGVPEILMRTALDKFNLSDSVV